MLQIPIQCALKSFREQCPERRDSQQKGVAFILDIEAPSRADSPIRIEPYPTASADIDNSPRLQVVVVEPDREWTDTGATRDMIRNWPQKRGESSRDYPAALVWCVKKPGRELREKAELVLAWRRVQKELQEGTLGTDVQAGDLRGVKDSVHDAEDELVEEAWASYRFVVIADSSARRWSPYH